MAIKITKPGQKEFHAFCKWCGCEFTYEISDLKLSATSDKLSCPTCGKDYHHQLKVPEPTLQPSIGYQWPSDSTDPCAGCVWRENLLRDGLYVGDTPCTWCNKGRFNVVTGKVTANDISVKDYTTPCINQLDTYLSTAQQQVYDASGVNSTVINAKSVDNTTQGTVMNTILECCHSCTDSLRNCGDTESKSCSGEHKCGDKKNCKGKHQSSI